MADMIASDVKEALTQATVVARPTAPALAEQQRSIAEVEAAMVIAKRNPRDIVTVIDRIKGDCMRISLAERALYTYARGGTDIQGPSIRLAEAIAQRWTNFQFGIRELDQRVGESVVQAYAWDIEANVRCEQTFTVKHIRDTKRGRVALEDSRDIYEMTANMGSRRLRACILRVIPGDVVEAAIDQVDQTLRTKAEVTPERITKVIDLFATYGVTREMIEKRIQRRIEAMMPAQLVSLGKIANSLRDGVSHPSDWFDLGAVASPSAEVPAGATSNLREKLRRAKRVRQQPSTEKTVEAQTSKTVVGGPLVGDLPIAPPTSAPAVGEQATAALAEDARRVVKDQPSAAELNWGDK